MDPQTRPGGPIQVLIANEPRSYREVLGAAVRDLRPEVVVTVVSPDQLDAQIAAMSPHVVVASRPPEADLDAVSRLVVLYPDGSNQATIDIDGVRSTVADLELDALIALIDATRAGGGSTADAGGASATVS